MGKSRIQQRREGKKKGVRGKITKQNVSVQTPPSPKIGNALEMTRGHSSRGVLWVLLYVLAKRKTAQRSGARSVN